jgi:hypothetical protein
MLAASVAKYHHRLHHLQQFNLPSKMTSMLLLKGYSNLASLCSNHNVGRNLHSNSNHHKEE